VLESGPKPTVAAIHGVALGKCAVVASPAFSCSLSASSALPVLPHLFCY
jgi:enoyl-CoA hydratase/carnithine racemase